MFLVFCTTAQTAIQFKLKGNLIISEMKPEVAKLQFQHLI